MIGNKIRAMRKQNKLTLKQLADLCDCSSSLISQIENGKINPSLSILNKISEAMGISLSWLVSENQPISLDTSTSLMHAHERKLLITNGGVNFQLLSRKIDVSFEFILNEWPPGSSTGDEIYTHEGEECGLLLEGELIVESMGRLYKMKPGDTITYNSSSPHRIYNPGKTKAVAIWVNSKPWIFSTK